MSFSVTLDREDQVFSAAHFITFNGNVCERLHGHNYRVKVHVEGPLDENHYVVDFIALRRHLLGILSELDHRMLVPLTHPHMPVTVDDEVTIRYESRRWVFPRGDCVLLDVANTTAELLAQWIGERLVKLVTVESLRVDVEECFGQWGTWSNQPAAQARA